MSGGVNGDKPVNGQPAGGQPADGQAVSGAPADEEPLNGQVPAAAVRRVPEPGGLRRARAVLEQALGSGAYREAAKTLIGFDAVTHDAVTSLRKGDLDLAIFQAMRVSRFSNEPGTAMADELGQGEMAVLLDYCRSRRSLAIDNARRELERRLPVMLAAAWVATGKTPRQHQDRYR